VAVMMLALIKASRSSSSLDLWKNEVRPRFFFDMMI
jgi:hypothetical protein